MLNYIKGNLLLFKFFFCEIPRIRSLPKWMRNPDQLQELFNNQENVKRMEPFEFELSKEHREQYNRGIEKLKSDLRELHRNDKDQMPYKMRLFLLYTIRLICVLTALYGNIKYTLLISALQFIVAPYSLFVSFALALALASPIYASHYIAYGIISSITNTILNGLQMIGIPQVADLLNMMSLPISGTFIIVFFALDQLYCLYCQYFTNAKEFTAKKMLIHLAWGFANTKTYHVVVLIHLWKANHSIPLWLWMVDAATGLTPLIAANVSRVWMHWMELFYHQHRMAHLPKVYEHAHKLHHYLHGTNAFDAHIYGNGMPEEYFFMLLELTMGVVYGIMPATLNRFILQHSLDNKKGHTEKLLDTAGENFHTDHHLLHSKNYGIYNCLMDMYFSTANFNERYRVRPNLYISGASCIFDVERIIDDQVKFKFTPIEKTEENLRNFNYM